MKKFSNVKKTADGSDRAYVSFDSMDTLWFNTGTICNLTCENCYIESSPVNDALVYLTLGDVRQVIEEAEENNLRPKIVGFTGGEPFINPYFVDIIEDVLSRKYEILILTNAMIPMMKCSDKLLKLHGEYGNKINFRVSVDHYLQEKHEEERGKRSWKPMLKGLKWLSDNHFCISVAGRTRWNGDIEIMRSGFQKFFDEENIKLDAFADSNLILFTEMDSSIDVPEITTECWDILDKKPSDIMCANSRMVVKNKGDKELSIIACTLLPFEKEFNLGSSIKDSTRDIYLNHPHCSRFCVLGGSNCSS